MKYVAKTASGDMIYVVHTDFYEDRYKHSKVYREGLHT
jgi:hypothetical protein